MANSVTKTRLLISNTQGLITLSQIKKELDLTSAEISMSVCYLLRQGSVDRIKIDNEGAGRKKVWAYQYKTKP
jgi:predicted transcriptional regulator